MQEEERRTGGVTPTKEDAGKDATSAETVSDLEKKGETNDSSDKSSGTSSGSTVPSPDGQFDDSRGGAGTGNETGPM